MYISTVEFEKALSPTLRRVLSTENDDQQDNTIIEEAIAQSSSLIDAYVGYRYNTPLDNVTPQVKAICCDIAVYRLFKRKDAVSEDISENYKLAIQFLKDVATDKALINGATLKGQGDHTKDTVSNVYAKSSSDKAKFDEENLVGWTVI